MVKRLLEDEECDSADSEEMEGTEEMICYKEGKSS
jgi:hypothetical protein